MRKNQPGEDNLDAQRRKQLKEIEEIDKKLQNWKFIADKEPISLPDSIRAHREVMELL